MEEEQIGGLDGLISGSCNEGGNRLNEIKSCDFLRFILVLSDWYYDVVPAAASSRLL